MPVIGAAWLPGRSRAAAPGVGETQAPSGLVGLPIMAAYMGQKCDEDRENRVERHTLALPLACHPSFEII